MEKRLPSEHHDELLAHSSKHFLNGCVVANERGGHSEASRWDVTHGDLHVMGDPIHKVVAVFLLDGKHLLIHFFGGHPTTEDASDREVAASPRVARCHHVAGVKHLLGELRYSESSVLLAATWRQRGKAWHEEMKAREGHHVDGELPQVGVELSRESQRSRDPAHGHGNQVVEVPVSRRGQF